MMLGATGWGSFHIRLRRRAGHTTSHHNTIRTASVTVSHEPVVGSRILWLLASVTTPTAPPTPPVRIAADTPLRHSVPDTHSTHTHARISSWRPNRCAVHAQAHRRACHAQHIPLAAARHRRFEIFMCLAWRCAVTKCTPSAQVARRQRSVFSRPT